MMKKALVLLIAVLICSVNIFSWDSASLSFTGNFLLTADQTVKNTYGNGIIYPGIRLNSGSLIYNEFYLWAGTSFLLLKDAAKEDKLTQFHFSLGCGYIKKFSHLFGFNLRIGGLGVMFKDESLNMEKEKFVFGFTGSAGLVFDWSDWLYSELEVGYSYAPGKTDDEQKVKLGGLKFALSLGIKF